MTQKRIYKYATDDQYRVVLPDDAKIVLAEPQTPDDGVTRFTIWAEVMTDPMGKPLGTSRTYQLMNIGTGWSVPFGWEHVRSYQDPPYVWHAYRNPVPIE